MNGSTVMNVAIKLSQKYYANQRKRFSVLTEIEEP
jgi:hypothetical protein